VGETPKVYVIHWICPRCGGHGGKAESDKPDPFVSEVIPKDASEAFPKCQRCSPLFLMPYREDWLGLDGLTACSDSAGSRSQPTGVLVRRGRAPVLSSVDFLKAERPGAMARGLVCCQLAPGLCFRPPSPWEI
jgi:hypothetical protein